MGQIKNKYQNFTVQGYGDNCQKICECFPRFLGFISIPEHFFLEKEFGRITGSHDNRIRHIVFRKAI